MPDDGDYDDQYDYDWTDSRGGRHTNGAAAFAQVQRDYDG